MQRSYNAPAILDHTLQCIAMYNAKSIEAAMQAAAAILDHVHNQIISINPHTVCETNQPNVPFFDHAKNTNKLREKN